MPWPDYAWLSDLPPAQTPPSRAPFASPASPAAPQTAKNRKSKREEDGGFGDMVLIGLFLFALFANNRNDK